MARSTFTVGLTCMALLGALSISHTPLFAEQGEEAVIYEIIVTAPRLTREHERRLGAGKVVLVERDEIVNIADLDLKKSADVIELENRIEAAATLICQELAREYPFGEPRTQVCIRRAITDARVQVEEAIRLALGR